MPRMISHLIKLVRVDSRGSVQCIGFASVLHDLIPSVCVLWIYRFVWIWCFSMIETYQTFRDHRFPLLKEERGSVQCIGFASALHDLIPSVCVLWIYRFVWIWCFSMIETYQTFRDHRFPLLMEERILSSLCFVLLVCYRFMWFNLL